MLNEFPRPPTNMAPCKNIGYLSVICVDTRMFTMQMLRQSELKQIQHQ